MSSVLPDENLGDALSVYQENNPYLDENYFCSFEETTTQPFGSFVSVLWFPKNQIYKVLELESKEDIRIFPRYFHHNEVIDNSEVFCWKNHLLLESLHFRKDKAKEDLEILQKELENSDISFDEVLEENPTIARPAIYKDIVEQKKKRDAERIDMMVEFMDILAADPSPWLGHDKFKCLWQARRPFWKEGLPETLSAVDLEPYKNTDQVDELKKMVVEIREKFKKNYIQSFLLEKHQEFIQGYITLSISKTFSYAQVWNLKKRYLHDLYDVMLKGLLEDADYAIWKEGKTWAINFAGKPIRGLKSKGFHHICYLISREGKLFSHKHLSLMDGRTDLFATPTDDEKIEKDFTPGKKSKKGIDSELTLYGKAKENIEAEYARLKQAYENALAGLDKQLITETKKEFDKFRQYSSEYYIKGDKIKKFESDRKSVTNRIAKNIIDALGELDSIEGAEKAHRHLSKSLKNLYASQIAYLPVEDITWST
jgi:hypothetical protein